MATLTLEVAGEGSVRKVHETDEFEDWARLAASIGQCTQRNDSDPARHNDKPHTNGSAVNGNATTNGHANANGHETTNGHTKGNGAKGNGAKVDRLPNFLLQGPAIDDEPLAGELVRAVVAKKRAGAERPRVEVADAAEPTPFLLTEALPEDLDIPPEPVTPPMSAFEQPLQGTTSKKAKVRDERSPAAVRPRQTEVSRKGFDGLPSAPASTKRVGVSAPPPADRRGLSRRGLRHRLQKGATVAAVGVTIGGVAVAILYIVIIATTTVV